MANGDKARSGGAAGSGESAFGTENFKKNPLISCARKSCARISCARISCARKVKFLVKFTFVPQAWYGWEETSNLVFYFNFCEIYICFVKFQFL